MSTNSTEPEQVSSVVKSSWLPFLPFVLFVVLALVFFMSIGRDPTLDANGMVGQSFPDFNIPQLVRPDQGRFGPLLSKNQLLDQLPPGAPWLVNVWASWCPQCYLEHGFIDALANAGIAVVGLNYKDEQVKANGFLRRMGNPYHVVLADEAGNLGFDLGVSGAPETYLVDSKGLILARHAGVLDRLAWDQKFAPLWQAAGQSALFSQESNK